MADESPAAILFDAAGNPLAPPSGTALPVGQGAVLVAGKDPVGDAQSVAVDTSGRPIIVGAGIAGTPTGGVASIQGVVGGTPMPITGSISATVVEADVGMIGVLAPTSASHTAGVDGAGLLQSERVHDLDTGGGTEFNLGASIRLPSLGGSVAGGTAVNPLRTDPTGTTTQPISAASLPLPTGAATEATLATRAGEHVTAVSSHAVRLTDGAAFYKATTPFDTQPVSAVSLPLPTGAATEATLTTRATEATLASIKDTDGIKKITDPLPTGANTIGKVDQGTGGASAWKVDGSAVTQPVSGTVTGNQGTPAVVGNAWPVKVSDGVDTVGISTVAGDKALKVDVVQTTGAGGMGTSQADKSSFVEGTTSFTPIGGVFNETISSDPTEDQAAAARITAKRAVHTNLRDSSGTEVGTSGAPLRTDPTGTTTQPVSAVSLPLPTGAATEVTLAAVLADTADIETSVANLDVALSTRASEATLATRLAEATFTARINTLGQKVMASSTPVVLASDQSKVPVEGTGIAGTPAGGVLSIQGVVGGTALPISGTITASDASVGTTGAAVPGSTQQNGGTDGVNLQANHMFDLDTTGGGTEYNLGVSLRKAALGGSVELGTSSDPVRTDPTGVTTQPVSGTVTANVGTTGGLALDATLTGGSQKTKIVDTGGVNVASVSAAGAVTVDGSAITQPISAAALPLPAGAATEATLATRLADATFTARINTLGQKTMAASTPVVIASDQSVVPVSDNGGSLTVDTPQLPAALVGGRLDENVGAWLGSTAPTVGQKTMANSVPVVLASDQAVNIDTGVADKTAFTYGTSVEQPIGGVFQDTSPAVTAGQTGAARITANRAIHQNLRDSSGNELLGSKVSASSIPVVIASDQGAVAVTGPVTDANLDEKFGDLGQKAMVGSAPVVIASDQSAVPVSGTVTANIGTTGGLALDATLTGGTQNAIVRGGAKGVTTAADVTSTAEGADHQALDVQLYHGGAAKDPTAIRALTAADVVTAAQGTAAAASSAWPTKISDGTDTVGISTVGGAKALKVDVIQTVGGGGTGVSQTDKSTFTEGTTAFTPVGGVYNETISSDPTEDQAAAARITAKRAVHTNLRNNSGTEVGTSGAPLRTDPTGTTAQPVTDNSGSLTVDTPQLPASLVGGRLDVVTTPATPTAAALTSASINASASGDNTLVAGTASQTVRIFRLFLVANDSVDIKFKDGAGTDLTPAMAMTKNGGMVLDMSGEPWFVTSASNGFLLNLSAAKQVSGRIYYTKS